MTAKIASTRPARSLTPVFQADVPTSVRNVVSALLAAYNRGDGKAAYGLMRTDREESRIMDAYESVQVPIMQLKVSSAGDNAIRIEYEIPHPGDIIAAVLEAGENIESAKIGLRQLAASADSVKHTETWRVVSTEGETKCDYGGKGILRFADLIGTDVHAYATDVQMRQFGDTPLPGMPLPFRVTSLMAHYFMCFDIDKESPEMHRLTKEMLAKIAGSLKSQLKDVTQPTYTLKVPRTWKEIALKSKDALMYSGKTAEGNEVVVCIKIELDMTSSPQVKDKSDQSVLWVFASLDQGKRKGKVFDAGDTEIAGAPAKFSLENRPDDASKRLLKYIFVKDKVVYSMMFGCEDQDFDASQTLFTKIKESFRFRK